VRRLLAWLLILIACVLAFGAILVVVATLRP
jgi:hypothetical protein